MFLLSVSRFCEAVGLNIWHLLGISCENVCLTRAFSLGPVL